MESCRRQIEKTKKCLYLLCARLPVRSFCFIPFLSQCQEDVAIWCDWQHCANMVGKPIPIYFSKQYFITILLPFYPPIFFTCVARVLFFFLAWSGNVQLKESKPNQYWFLSSYLHLCTLLFFSLHSVVACFIFVKIHSGAKWITMQSTFSSTTVLWSCRCHFSVCLRQIVNRLSNPTQNVPSCSFYC